MRQYPFLIKKITLAIVNSSVTSRNNWHRLLLAALLALLLHLVLLFGIAPYLKMKLETPTRTEVIQINPQELARLKKEILSNKTLPPLLKQELNEKFKTKEAPKNAKFMGAFNQTVPEEMVAGAQKDTPEDGGGKTGSSASSETSEKKVDLAKIGLGTKVPLPTGLAQPNIPQGPKGPEGPEGQFRPVGREDKNLKLGDRNLLNAVENEYYSFFVRFEEPIIRNWFFLLRSLEGKIHREMADRKIRVGAELDIAVEFVIDRQGAFKSVTLIQSSNVPTLDWATREAVAKLGSLPNPPPGIFEGGQYFSYRLQFGVHVTNTPVSSSAPGLHWY